MTGTTPNPSVPRSAARPALALALPAILVLLHAPRPAQAAEEPAMTPSSALWLSIGTSAGLGLAGIGTAVGGVPVLGLTLLGLTDFSPELGYYATGHWARGITMWALRQLVVAAGAGIGYGLATTAEPDTECTGGDECNMDLSGLGLVFGLVLGGSVGSLGFALYEWSDQYRTVDADWEEYEARQAAESWTARVNVGPLIAPAPQGGVVGGLHLAVRF
jgi:hypothetical protein